MAPTEEFWDRIRRVIDAATRRAFVALHKAYPEEQLYVFGLCGNSGGQSISLVANTIQSLAERAKADLKSRINECATVEKATEEARWNAGSWPYFDKIDAEFREVNSLIEEQRRSLKLPPVANDDASEQFMEQLHEVCTHVLEGLNEEGFFGKGSTIPAHGADDPRRHRSQMDRRPHVPLESQGRRGPL